MWCTTKKTWYMLHYYTPSLVLVLEERVCSREKEVLCCMHVYCICIHSFLHHSVSCRGEYTVLLLEHIHSTAVSSMQYSALHHAVDYYTATLYAHVHMMVVVVEKRREYCCMYMYCCCLLLLTLRVESTTACTTCVLHVYYYLH